MVIYDSGGIYVTSATTLSEKVTRIRAVIEALELKALDAAGTGNFSEYSLDDGQTKIRTVYRNAADVAAAIDAFEKILQRYLNQLNGRVVRLVDSKNMTGGR